MAVGVITHLHNADFAELRGLAQTAETAGADWLGIPDAFWWRDGWMLLAEAARVTERIELGPMVTNPYLRHPFHTVAAVATLQDIAGPRVFLGVAAGGAEVTGAAGVSRRDAPERVRALAGLLRRVARGEPLDPVSGRALEVPLRPAPVLIAGRGDGILDAAGRAGDRALLWAVPQSDLQRSAGVIENGAQQREAPGPRPELVWAPLVDFGGASRERVRTIAAYSVLNSSRALQQHWGLDATAIEELRARLVAGGARAASDLVPAAALDDLILSDSPTELARLGSRLGATSIALPAFNIDELPERIAWAHDVSARFADRA
jgi:5,10-methylenetetrahydromethanopterin reductase